MKDSLKYKSANIYFFSISSGYPRTSSYPWPETSAKGGGIIQPVQYKISAPASLTDRIKYILMCAASDEQDILKEMNVHMSFFMI